MYAGGGALVDALGTKRGLLAIMIGWSLATATHGLATGFRSLLVSRFLLGMGEGGGFPAATKAVSEWFPASERSTAMGIINAGTAVGAVVAPPAIAAILGVASWRWVFFATGAVGLVWTMWWMRDYRTPDVSAASAPAVAAIPWPRLLRFREVWGLVVAKFLSDAAWYFYLFWLPKYLYDVRGFDVKRVGTYAWIPYAAAGVGCLAGGWFSSWLLKRGSSVNLSRKAALGASAAVMPLIVFVTQAPTSMAIVLFSIAFFGQQSWSTLVMIVPTDLFDRRIVASVAGLVGFGGAMGGVVFNLVVGRILDSGLGYGTVFAIVGSFHVIAFVVILLAIPVVRPLSTGSCEILTDQRERAARVSHANGAGQGVPASERVGGAGGAKPPGI
jgi:MFS transporter, ACS family, hexuronate transporter